MDTQKEVITLLNDLLEENCDSKQGYQKAAEHIDDPTLKGLFMSLSSQRENFKKSIREEIHFLGGEPIYCGEIAGSIQEAFSSPNLLLSLDTVEQTLKGCLSLEMKHLEFYRQMLNGNEFEASTRNLIVGQCENIKLSLHDVEKTLNREKDLLSV